MPNPRLAGRYAKSLIDLAIERGILEDVNDDVEYILALLKLSSELGRVLSSPIIKEEKKLAVLTALTQGKITATTSSFFGLLLRKNRENALPEIAHAFKDQYNEIKGITKVKLVTAHPATEELRAGLLKKLAAEAGLNNIELELKVDESLIGGFVLEYNNKIVNASIKNELEQVKKSFLRNDYIFNIR